jgi:hypothetical protein
LGGRLAEPLRDGWFAFFDLIARGGGGAEIVDGAEDRVQVRGRVRLPA